MCHNQPSVKKKKAIIRAVWAVRGWTKLENREVDNIGVGLDKIGG